MIKLEDNRIEALYDFVEKEFSELRDRLSIYGLSEEEVKFFENWKEEYIKFKDGREQGNSSTGGKQ